MSAVVGWLSNCIYELQDVLLTSNAYFRYMLYVLFTAFIGGFAIELVLSLILSINVKKIVLFSPKNYKRYSSGEFSSRNTNIKTFNRSRGILFSRRYNPYALKHFSSLVTSKNFYTGSVKQFSGAVSKQFRSEVIRNFAPLSSRQFSGAGVRQLSGLSARQFSGADVRSFSPFGSKNFRVYFSRYFRAGVRQLTGLSARQFSGAVAKQFRGEALRGFSPVFAKQFSGSIARSFYPSTAKNFRITFARYFRPSSVRNYVSYRARGFFPVQLKQFIYFNRIKLFKFMHSEYMMLYRSKEYQDALLIQRRQFIHDMHNEYLQAGKNFAKNFSADSWNNPAFRAAKHHARELYIKQHTDKALLKYKADRQDAAIKSFYAHHPSYRKALSEEESEALGV